MDYGIFVSPDVYRQLQELLERNAFMAGRRSGRNTNIIPSLVDTQVSDPTDLSLEQMRRGLDYLQQQIYQATAVSSSAIQVIDMTTNATLGTLDEYLDQKEEPPSQSFLDMYEELLDKSIKEDKKKAKEKMGEVLLEYTKQQVAKAWKDYKEDFPHCRSIHSQNFATFINSFGYFPNDELEKMGIEIDTVHSTHYVSCSLRKPLKSKNTLYITIFFGARIDDHVEINTRTWDMKVVCYDDI